MERWNGRIAMVTGASAGIGAAICKSLVQSGMIVYGAAQSVERIQRAAEEMKGDKGSLFAVKCDVTKDDDVYSLFKTIKEEHGGVDICINNVGISYNKNLLNGTPDEWRSMMDVNVIALCLCTKLAVASMKEMGVDDGQVINVSSCGGHLVSELHALHFYCATKFAVRAITEGLRQELREAKSHIRVSSVSPGVVETEFAYTMGGEEHAKALYSSSTWLQADDIAATVVHMISAPPHVESVSPGVVETEFAYTMGGEEHAKALYSSSTWLQADDIAATVVHMISAPPHVESVSPGVVETEFAYTMGGEEHAKALYSSSTWLQADDIAATVVHMISAPPHVESVSPGVVETEFAYTMGGEEHAKALYSSSTWLQADDTAATVVHMISAPPHVEINDVVVRSTQ